MKEFLTRLVIEFWSIMGEAAPFLLIGFVFAGLIRVFLNEKRLESRLGGSSFSSVVWAGLIGVPLPLCSCGVLPVAASLRESGAGRGATASFLVSTPESGVDSIFISYALLDPFLTIIRPISAFITAIAAGISINLFDNSPQPTGQAGDKLDTCCEDECHTGENLVSNPQKSFYQRFKEGLHYSFTDLLPSLSMYTLQGLFLAALLMAILPPDFFQTYLKPGPLSLFVMLLAGIPIYICATSSTPIAAALILKGISPGAALVFLLAGPATNIATILVIRKILGGRSLMFYLIAVCLFALGFGFATDWIYGFFDWEINVRIAETSEGMFEALESFGSIVLLPLLMWGTWKENLKPRWQKRKNKRKRNNGRKT